VISVLVVEDDRTVATVHRRVVERVPGFALIGVAYTGREAIERVLEDRPKLVVLDIYLPDVPGLEVLRRIRAAGLGTDVIVISAAREPDTVREALRAGAVDYLLKPFRVDRLIESLKAYQRRLAELEREGQEEVSQAEIDRLLGRAQAGPGELELPKGVDSVTLHRILQVFDGSPQGLTSEEVARAAGVSRSTAHRYLRYLATTGEIDVEPLYGSVGRPELRYRKRAE